MTKEFRRFLTGPLFPASLLIFTFLLTLLLFALFRPEKDGRIFFFPDNSGTFIAAERRGIPQRDKLPGQIRVFLDELLLGPESLGLSFAAPRGTVVNHVAVVEKTVYVDLSTEILDKDETSSMSFVAIMENLRHNMVFNFPKIEEVVFTIEGQQVGVPLYRGAAEAL